MVVAVAVAVGIAQKYFLSHHITYFSPHLVHFDDLCIVTYFHTYDRASIRI